MGCRGHPEPMVIPTHIAVAATRRLVEGGAVRRPRFVRPQALPGAHSAASAAE